MKQNLIDQARFVVEAGRGGDGSISFRREKFITKGGPDGGDGGKGGSIWLEADPHVATLRFFAGRDRFEADRGGRGSKKNQSGHDAEDITLKVPVGTLVKIRRQKARMLKGNDLYGEHEWQEIDELSRQPFQNTEKRRALNNQTLEERFGVLSERLSDLETERIREEEGEMVSGENQESRIMKQAEAIMIDQDESPLKAESYDLEADWLVVADMTEPGMRLELAKKGKGGRGNERFKSSRLTTPRFAEKGEGGERFEVQLELRVLANVGLVGMPSVGKSTLLSVLSNAKPEIADYPFTTLSPNLGVMSRGNSKHEARNSKQDSRFQIPNSTGEKVLTIADIPGLIEGAHEGKGLGIGFLKHIERCSLLIYVLAPTEEMLSVVDGLPMTGSEMTNNQNPNSKQKSNSKSQTLDESITQGLWGQYEMLRKELGEYDPDLLQKPFVVVVNKSDLLGEELRAKSQELFRKKEVEVVLVSAATREGLEELVGKITKN